MQENWRSHPFGKLLRLLPTSARPFGQEEQQSMSSPIGTRRKWRAWRKISEFRLLIFAFLPAKTKRRLICSIVDWRRFGLTQPASTLR